MTAGGSDRVSGSVDLLDRAAEAVQAHLQKHGTAGLPELLDALAAEHPAMALRLNLAASLRGPCAEGREAAGQALARFLTGVTLARLQCAAQFAALVHQYRWTSVATYSRSGQVRECLAAGRAAGLKSAVLSEARPAGEGVLMARELRGEGYEVALTADAALPAFLADVDALVVGADADAGDRFVNKTGTALLLREARLKSCSRVVLTLPQKRLAPAQLLAMQLASVKGLSLDQPRGLRKITRTR